MGERGGYDWECDPRDPEQTCPEGQYPADPNAPAFSGDMASMMAMMAGMMSGFNQENFKYTTTNGNVTEMVQGGMPGYINHVVISPVMEQSIGDPDQIALEAGDDQDWIYFASYSSKFLISRLKNFYTEVN